LAADSETALERQVTSDKPLNTYYHSTSAPFVIGSMMGTKEGKHLTLPKEEESKRRGRSHRERIKSLVNNAEGHSNNATHNVLGV
jgi:hypothetical protein